MVGSRARYVGHAKALAEGVSGDWCVNGHHGVNGTMVLMIRVRS